jgi:L,D-transpeptidase ErfK/SrfK
LMMTSTAFAVVYNLPANGDSVVGSNQVARLKMGDTLSAFAQRNGVGYYEVLDANPGLDPLRLSSGAQLLVRNQFVLPNAPRQGIVINLAELRLYYYPAGSNNVVIYPIGIGRIGWQTPTGQLSVIQKKQDPDWRVPPAVAADMAKRGIILPEVIPAGPDNPLGRYMMRLSNYSYLIHSTNKPSGVGRRTSAGCIRMYPEDAEQLFNMVPVGTKVTIVNQPFKAGWLNGQLYFEAHSPLREQRAEYAGRYNSLWDGAVNTATEGKAATVDWAKVQSLGKKQTGVPQVVGVVAGQSVVTASAKASDTPGG